MHSHLQGSTSYNKGILRALYSIWLTTFTHTLTDLGPEHASWLAPVAPILLSFFLPEEMRALWFCTGSHVHLQTKFLLQACESSIAALPMLNRTALVPNNHRNLHSWLLQHPQQQAAVQAALSSGTVRWFLWTYTAAAVGKLHSLNPGPSNLCNSDIYADHNVALAASGAEIEFFDPRLECYSWTLSCLSYLHMQLPAEQVLRSLVEDRVGDPAADAIVLSSTMAKEAATAAAAGAGREDQGVPPEAAAAVAAGTPTGDDSAEAAESAYKVEDAGGEDLGTLAEATSAQAAAGAVEGACELAAVAAPGGEAAAAAGRGELSEVAAPGGEVAAAAIGRKVTAAPGEGTATGGGGAVATAAPEGMENGRE